MAYIVRASELFQKAKEILNDGMDFVELEYLEADNSFPDDPLPPSIVFSAFKKSDPLMSIDYEEIEVLSPDQLD